MLKVDELTDALNVLMLYVCLSITDEEVQWS